MLDIMNFCTPALVYLGISAFVIIAALASQTVSLYSAFFKALFALIWSMILNFICSKGYTSVSWVLVLLPYILIAFAFFSIVDVVANTAVIKPNGITPFITKKQ
jgi:hypothetical protein